MTQTLDSRARLDGLLRRFRRRAGLTQRQVADLAGMSVAGLRDLEQGRVLSPRAGTLRRLATALELSTTEAAELLRVGQAGQLVRNDLWVGVLGHLSVQVDGAEVDPGSARQRLLLGVLAVSPNVAVGRDELIETGWGEQPPANVVELLQTNMSRLRRRLQSAQPDAAQSRVLVAVRGGYRLEVTEDQLDLLAFRRWLARAREAGGGGDRAAACAMYREAFGFWRGDPLADLVTLRVHPAVVALSREWQAAVVEYAAVAVEAGRPEEVLPLLRQVVGADPLHEPAHARLMTALAAAGQQAEALAVFADLRARLSTELGADPGVDVLDAHQRVLRQEVVPGGAAGEEAPVSAHRQLPPDIADFIGRCDELAEVRTILEPAAGVPTAVPIVAIEGMAGVGKTRLAVHLAHQLHAEGRFDELQLYVDLHAHSAQPPADPAAVLASFLNLLGVPGGQIPAGTDERAALYRDRLHGRRTLVLLDNAASAEQVRPLLPANPASLVLVTSRRSLAVEGAHTVPLDVFEPTDAERLLVRIVGQARVGVDRLAARAVVELCGRLPLAVALVARRLQARPAWGFAELAVRLRDTGDRMSELAAGTRRVRAAFDLSYQALDGRSQHVFRLLGLHPGEDFTADSTAALAQVPPADARRLLDNLVDEHLVIATAGDRYRLHDLLREYATELAGELTGEERGDALHRVLRWYVHASRTARKFMPAYWGNDVELSEPPPAPVPAIADREAMFEWLAAEQAVLVASVGVAFEHGFPQTAREQASILSEYLHRTSNWAQWIRTSEVGLAAARILGDRRVEAIAMMELSAACGQSGQLDRAYHLTVQAMRLFHAVGAHEFMVWVRNQLGIIRGIQGDLDGAMSELEEGLRIADRPDPHLLNNLGRVHRLRGEHELAVECFERVLGLLDQVPEHTGAVGVWKHSLGESLVLLGRYDEAIPLLEEVCRSNRDDRYLFFEAEALETLGTALAAAGRVDEARESWQQALRILGDLGLPHGEALRERLESLNALSPS